MRWSSWEKHVSFKITEFTKPSLLSSKRHSRQIRLNNETWVYRQMMMKALLKQVNETKHVSWWMDKPVRRKAGTQYKRLNVYHHFSELTFTQNTLQRLQTTHNWTLSSRLTNTKIQQQQQNGFRRRWTEFFRLLCRYAEWSDFKPIFRDHISVPPSRVKLLGQLDR